MNFNFNYRPQSSSNFNNVYARVFPIKYRRVESPFSLLRKSGMLKFWSFSYDIICYAIE